MLKTKWKKTAAAALALGMVGFGTVAWAHGPGQGRFMKHMLENRISDAEDFIEATPAQRQTIDAAKADILTKLQSHAKGNHDMHAQLLALLTADKFDAGQAQQMADDKAAELRELAKELIPEVQKIHDTLTPAQRQKLAEHVQKMQARHHAQEEE